MLRLSLKADGHTQNWAFSGNLPATLRAQRKQVIRQIGRNKIGLEGVKLIGKRLPLLTKLYIGSMFNNSG
jgi:hypothetical protein